MSKSAGYRRHLPSSPFNTPVVPPPEQFAVGNRVTHDEHGLGRVIGVEDETAVLVDFGGLRARVKSPFSKMTKL
ncbi:hypothetical protein KBZ10_14910 [Streptomyces sp. F63]|uniref:hypothetical protein n=1 Tax=Streptomyces sp. F63 TaxID=2824887 RepID=UPI001B3717D9|nr:hypothetical protein [Streptomyces sp. F63]MBQ0985783.1 hypothetical protein [Streptomyces sp. F63]